MKMVRVAGFEPATTRLQTEDSTRLSYTLLMDGVLGFEPKITESKSAVIPLHQTPMKNWSSDEMDI